MRKTIVVVDDFYDDPHAVRRHALSQGYCFPYQRDAAIESGEATPSWMTSRFLAYDRCRFKSSPALRQSLEAATGEPIDLTHWQLDFPLDAEGKPDRDRIGEAHSCLWNCCFHVKFNRLQQLGEGVHNHVTDAWNSVGEDGWSGLLYLSPDAPLEGGLKLWRPVDARRRFDWMTSKHNWELIDSLGNVFNRLLLVRGDVPHSGAAGWGDSLATGRMFQTFFFKSRKPQTGRHTS